MPQLNDRAIATLFVAALLAIAGVLVMNVVADSRRAAELARSRPLRALAAEARASYKIFTNGATDVVETGTLGSSSAQALAAAATRLAELERASASATVADTATVVGAIARAIAPGATLGDLVALRPQIARGELLTKALQEEFERRDEALIREAIGSAGRQETQVIASLLGTTTMVTGLVLATRRRLRLRLEAEAALERERRTELETLSIRFRVAIGAAQAGVYEWRGRGGRMWWNDTMSALHRREPMSGEPTLRGWLASMHAEDRATVKRGLVKALRERSRFRLLYRIPCPDGTLRPMESIGAVVVDAHEARLTLVGIACDITERVAAEQREAQALRENSRISEELHRANAAMQAAEAANRAKSEFLATMSHELRTPMNGVLGFTRILLETPVTEEQRGFLRTIDMSGQALMALLNDILDYSKIEAGMLAVEQVAFDLPAVIEEATTLLAAKYAEKNVDLIVQCDAAFGLSARGDYARVRQVLMNLLGNALKFTPAGHVLVEVCGAGPERLRVNVTDTGIGIAADVQQKLFRKFVQADSTTTRRYGGTGLGLAISKQLVELMGGTIGVHSVPGAGATFWFELPRARDGVAPAQVEPATHATAAAPLPKRVLIVDDIEPNRRMVEYHADRWGMRSRSVASAEDALAALREAHASGEPYEAAIVDHMMPGTDGEALCGAIRAEAAFADLAIVFFTSAGHPAEAGRMQRIGYDALVLKPLIHPARLCDALREARARRVHRGALALIEAAEAAPAAPTPVPAAAAVPAAVDALPPAVAGRASVLLAEDNLVNRMLAVHMLEGRGYRVEVAEDGAEALAQVQRQRFALIFMDCHMPTMDGFEATAAIRSWEAGRGYRTPIVAFTAGVMADERAKCVGAGMDDFLGKPIAPAELEAILRRWLPAAAEPATPAAAGASAWAGASAAIR